MLRINNEERGIEKEKELGRELILGEKYKQMFQCVKKNIGICQER